MAKDKTPPQAAAQRGHSGKSQYLCGQRILPAPISPTTDIVQLVDCMDAYNGGRLRAACHLLRDG